MSLSYESVLLQLLEVKEFEAFFQSAEMPCQLINPPSLEIPHPPAFLPFWEVFDCSQIEGIWKRFSSDKEDYYATIYLDGRPEVVSRGNRTEQFLSYRILTELEWNDGSKECSPYFKNLASLFELDLSLLSKAYLKKIAPNQIVNLEWPLSDSSFGKHSLVERAHQIAPEQLSELECSESVLDSISFDMRPDWFHPEKAKQIFKKSMKEGAYQTAWLSLNSSGWTYYDAKEGFQKICSEVNDEIMNKICDVWCSQDWEDDWSF